MSETKDPIVIVSAVRTPIGSFPGALKGESATALGAATIKQAVHRAKLGPDQIDEVLMGCVLPAGLGQAPARQAAIHAGLPQSVPCSTINKVCGSGMKTVMLGADLISAGSADIVVAGGMESMTNSPYLLEKARSGYRMGHGKIYDHMFLDGLEDAYDKGRAMGTFAEETADQYQFTREQQDEFALRSLSRSLKATEAGNFANELVNVAELDRDEQPTRAKPEKIPNLKPAFREGGTITAANSSSISDGAASLTLMRLSKAEKLGIEPLAVIRGHASHAQQPSLFTTAPIFAMRKLFDKTGWNARDVDLFEINEAFAVVVMAAMQELDLPADKVNIHGGACAMGHPIGCSGARIIVTLLHAMKQNDLKRGMASVCIGGGEATAIAVETI
ncbi:acetyl-CoA C-acyltransferase [Ochrobactrum sp. Marseille-Q0166]|uniref:acetyl-CoA C-acyltransferase n=1 Tax=Ochrobactrum sp. Marseille-Q0166 TaxID=2761105 RepID=UPI00165675E8|nr:acetyl-CoA C-acyltransferase [Ochrobactrum sp. Marseille-Q0166]MBC8716881.1 acetyl-CoA C-acyltransferase [Ochrobactrum sp. Marseille-Q0166]